MLAVKSRRGPGGSVAYLGMPAGGQIEPVGADWLIRSHMVILTPTDERRQPSLASE